MAFLLGEALYETESTSQEPLILVANEAIGKAKGSFYNFFHNIRTPWDVGKRLEDGTYENSESYYYP